MEGLNASTETIIFLLIWLLSIVGWITLYVRTIEPTLKKNIEKTYKIRIKEGYRGFWEVDADGPQGCWMDIVLFGSRALLIVVWLGIFFFASFLIATAIEVI